MLKHWIQSQTDRVIGKAYLLAVLTYGSLFLLGGSVLLLHRWVGWWVALLITGSIIVQEVYCFRRE
jgi:hypothetical protein